MTVNMDLNPSPVGANEIRKADATLSDTDLEALNGGGAVVSGIGAVAGFWTGVGGGAIAAGPIGAAIGGLVGALAGGVSGALAKD